jgi:hypothetical protein
VGVRSLRSHLSAVAGDVYVSRIFSQISFNGLVMDLENYPFLDIATLLDTLADRLRQKHGKYRDRKMPSFYALQILNGQRHDLEDLLKPLVKPFGSVFEAFT